VIVSVRDSGEGVPSALRDVIFDRGVTSRPESHSGLGLFAARRLARSNGGDVRISSDDTATFELRLPTRRPDATVIDLTDNSNQQPDIRSLHG
jgi:two-component system CitB family sensor kinase